MEEIESLNNNLLIHNDVSLNGNIKVNDKILGNSQQLELYTNTTSNNSFSFLEMRSDITSIGCPKFRILTDSSDKWYGYERFTIDNSGNVGIGVKNPDFKLDVSGQIRSTSVNIVTNNDIQNQYMYISINNDILNDFFRNRVGLSMSDITTGGLNRCFAFGFDGTGNNYNVHVFMLNPFFPVIHSVCKFENDNFSTGSLNFTGQHRCIANKFLEGNLYYGLIVCAKKNRYINFKNELDVTINENLPEVSLSEKENDKSVFGVISSGEDTNNSREYSLGRFTSIFYKTTSNENRMIINSIGEGGIWVSNKNGTLESGDYISSSSIKGYGQKQINNEGILCNYTVAKITCDCEFTLVKKEKKKIKMKDVIVNEKNIVKNPENNQEQEVITEKKLKEFIYDNNGNLQYDNDLDENGNIQYEYEYDTRFLDENANILSGEEEYLSRLNNDENVYIACFVGCTYHCG